MYSLDIGSKVIGMDNGRIFQGQAIRWTLDGFHVLEKKLSIRGGFPRGYFQGNRDDFQVTDNNQFRRKGNNDCVS